MELSIILPVYNVEKYLDECLYSLANQTLSDYEVIVINDGTKDNSQDIIDRYVEKYPAVFRSYIVENAGVSAARNLGVKYARGKYITFLDSDDYVELDLYKNMVDIAEENNHDLVVADLEYFWENESDKKVVSHGINRVSDNDVKNLFLSPLFSWNKIYSRHFFIDLGYTYPIGKWYEDIPVTLKVFSNISSVGYYSKTGYHYRQRNTSILGTAYSDKMYDIFTIFEGVIHDFKDRGKYEEFKDELEYLFIEHFLWYGAFRFLRTDHYKELMEKAFVFIKEYFPDYRKNKYFSTIPLRYRIFILTNNERTMGFWHRYLVK